MPEKIAMELKDVQKTLLLPLWGRASETRKKDPLLIDKTAADIIDKINYDFSTIAGNMSEISRLQWIVRCIHTDRAIKAFLEKHSGGTIVNIGCGLDTTFERVDNGRLLWYDLDLPDVIKLRSEFIKENDRRKFIASSFLDDAWLKKLKINDNVFFFAMGVFYYFEEKQMREFFIKLAGLFPESEVFFDSASPLGVKVANKKVIQDGGMDSTSILKWGIKKAGIIESWDPRIKLIDEIPMFRDIRKKLDRKGKIGALMTDLLRIMTMVHLKFIGK